MLFYEGEGGDTRNLYQSVINQTVTARMFSILDILTARISNINSGHNIQY